MLIDVFLDGNVFNFFFNRQERFRNFAAQMPAEKYKLHITPEVEREIDDIPDISKSSRDNAPLKKFIQEFRQKNIVERQGYFSLATYGDDEETLKYKDGFGVYEDEGGGSFMTYDEANWIGAGNNITDRLLSVRSIKFIVLTCDNKRHLRQARCNHLKIILLGKVETNDAFNPLDQSGLTLDAYIEKVLISEPKG